MTRIVEHVRVPDASVLNTWETILQSLPRYSLYQTPRWSAVLNDSLPEVRAEHSLFVFDDGVEAVLPLFSVPARFGLRRRETLPWGTYGGLLSGGPLSAAHRDACIRHLLQWKFPVMKWVEAPGCMEEHGLPDGWNVHQRTTHVLPLNAPFEDLFQSEFSPRNRNYIRKLQKAGVQVQARTDPDAVSIFADLYRDSMRHWSGSETYPPRFFEILPRHLGESLKLWIGVHEGNALSANLIGYGKGEVLVVAGASRRDAEPSRSSRLVMNDVIRDACAQGYLEVNFGASGSHGGVEQFKRSFAARERGYLSVIGYHAVIRTFRP